MILTLKSISRKINDAMFNGEVPIIYRNESEKIDQNSIVYFVCVSGAEREKYEQLKETDKKEFVSTSEYISIPIMHIEKLYEIHNRGISCDYPETISMIKNVIPVNKDNEKLLFALFLILHEFGHWNDFVSKCKKPYLYTSDEKEQKEVYDLKRKILADKSLQYMSEHKIKTVLRDYLNRYNSVPCEKRANEFAISKICDAYKLFEEIR